MPLTKGASGQGHEPLAWHGVVSAHHEQESQLQLRPGLHQGEIRSSKSETGRGVMLVVGRSSRNQRGSSCNPVSLTLGITLIKFMIQDVIWYPWASASGRLGGLDLTSGRGCGAGGRDTPASLAASANYQSLCRHFAWLLRLQASTAMCKLLRNSTTALLLGNMSGYFIDPVNKGWGGEFLHCAKESFLPPPCCLDLCHCLNLSRFAIPTSAV